ncbi:MAG: hypothetical protein A3J28_03760 [Acidobacteria bacterium RIFCSPLOWO2_12_FULL_60_22]|nr:MAG: hypothetical protein A3J28_03760 [Acidobacteria bacterium RIFCSPLOWO2_12_FULL_60_22]
METAPVWAGTPRGGLPLGRIANWLDPFSGEVEFGSEIAHIKVCRSYTTGNFAFWGAAVRNLGEAERSVAGRLNRKTKLAALGTPPWKRAVAVAALAFFCFPLSRFFHAVELTSIHCLDPDHPHAVASDSEHGHSHTLQSLSKSHDSGYFFQHCKDVYEGMGLPPVQALGVPLTAFYEQPEASLRPLASELHRLPEAYPPLPFHPPRHPA